MAGLTSDDFSIFFESVHNKPDTPEHERKRPFDWQNRLADQVLNRSGWPDVIRVPTACGKTSVLDVALFELALQAEMEPSQRRAARRICFVIDRRLVVDEVTDHAREIREAVVSAAGGERDGTVLNAVAQSLASLAADPNKPLRVVRLRGGVYRDDGWAADPLTPTILISTVDQIGSRLLFRGYGVSRRSRPVHAGLLAFDSRIILDEAHLSMVFAETIESVKRYHGWAERPLLPAARRVSVVHVSATAGDRTRVFELLPHERKEKRLAPRLEASKTAELIETQVTSVTKEMREKQPRLARATERKNREALAQDLVTHAKRLAGIGGDGSGASANPPRVIGVVVNRVATARRVFDSLRAQPTGELERDAILLTGRIRPYDRDRLLEKWLWQIKAGRVNQPERVLFVVATQTVEVGANLDFDALITEAAPLDALRQRFGRLDRLGKRHEQNASTSAAILIQKSKSDDAIYGPAIAETWKWLKKNASKKKGRHPTIDFGVNNMDRKLPQDPAGLRPLLAPRPDAPLLFPAHLDAWVQTDPLPDPDPDVAPFLHGAADDAADVLVVWRADLSPSRRRLWNRVVSLVPPRTSEALPVPAYELRAWLRDGAEADVADVEGVATSQRSGPGARGRRVLRWRGPEDAMVVGPEDVRSGDTIVVPATYGGADAYGWNPTSKSPVVDVADSCLARLIASYPKDAFRRPLLRLRLHPSLFPRVDETEASILRNAVAAARAEDGDVRSGVRRLLLALTKYINDPVHCRAIEAALEATTFPQIELYPKECGLILVGSLPVAPLDDKPTLPEGLEEPDDDEASFAAGGRQVPLVEHTQAVEQVAGRFGRSCGLPIDDIEAICLAACWHDEGKRDRRFQAWLHGSELMALAALAADQPLAKSGRSTTRRGSRFGYPRGARHEFVSVRLFEQAERLNGGSGEIAKLLIGTHHGHGRPFPPVVKDKLPIGASLTHGDKILTASSMHGLDQLDSGWVDLFWRMVRRYGWWGLAYLESMLVTADRFVSAHEQAKRPDGIRTKESAQCVTSS